MPENKGTKIIIQTLAKDLKTFAGLPLSEALCLELMGYLGKAISSLSDSLGEMHDKEEKS